MSNYFIFFFNFKLFFIFIRKIKKSYDSGHDSWVWTIYDTIPIFKINGSPLWLTTMQGVCVIEWTILNWLITYFRLICNGLQKSVITLIFRAWGEFSPTSLLHMQSSSMGTTWARLWLVQHPSHPYPHIDLQSCTILCSSKLY